ncbi:MAG: EAL domain-containing protein [Rhizobiales bacterium]|nr:EAL domain-containing protein [Hyphomicrobiales bacterium]
MRIIRGAISLISELNAKVVVEGIEHKTQFKYAKAMGADLIQEFLLGKPIFAKSIKGKYLAENTVMLKAVS